MDNASHYLVNIYFCFNFVIPLTFLNNKSSIGSGLEKTGFMFVRLQFDPHLTENRNRTAENEANCKQYNDVLRTLI